MPSGAVAGVDLVEVALARIRARWRPGGGDGEHMAAGQRRDGGQRGEDLELGDRGGGGGGPVELGDRGGGPVRRRAAHGSGCVADVALVDVALARIVVPPDRGRLAAIVRTRVLHACDEGRAAVRKASSSSVFHWYDDCFTHEGLTPAGGSDVYS